MRTYTDITGLDVTGHSDGVALWLAGEVVEVFGSLWEANIAKRAAEQALTQLDAALARMSGGKT
jgi:hypothetical protein